MRYIILIIRYLSPKIHELLELNCYNYETSTRLICGFCDLPMIVCVYEGAILTVIYVPIYIV